jgi:hypothetical protein
MNTGRESVSIHRQPSRRSVDVTIGVILLASTVWLVSDIRVHAQSSCSQKKCVDFRQWGSSESACYEAIGDEAFGYANSCCLGSADQASCHNVPYLADAGTSIVRRLAGCVSQCQEGSCSSGNRVFIGTTVVDDISKTHQVCNPTG